MPPDNDKGRPGEGRPRNDLLAGEITANIAPLGVTVPLESLRMVCPWCACSQTCCRSAEVRG